MTEQQIENEIKLMASQYFELSFSNESGYVTEKLERIKNLSSGSAWVAFQMLHPVIRIELFPRMSKYAQQYLKDKQVI